MNIIVIIVIIQVLARDDDVINVAGHRLSTSAIEEVGFPCQQLFSFRSHIQTEQLSYDGAHPPSLMSSLSYSCPRPLLVLALLPLFSQVVLRHPLVIDCAVVGVSDKLKGQMPLGLVVTRGEVSSS